MRPAVIELGWYIFSEAEIVFLQGLGDIGTFWLLGKDKFPYNIDLEKAELQVVGSTYWKTDNTHHQLKGNVLVE